MVPILIFFPRCAAEAPRTPKITKNDLPDMFFPPVPCLVFVFSFRISSQLFSLVLSLTDRTLPRNGRQLRPSSGLQNTLTQNWRELRPYSDLHNSLSNKNVGAPSFLRPTEQPPKKMGHLRPSSDLQNNLPKHGAGSFHGDSDCKRFSNNASFRASV